MLRMPRLSGVLAVALMCTGFVAGCGDDDSDGDGDAGGSGSNAGRGGSGGDGGTLPRRDGGTIERGDEGFPCTPSEPCNDGLRCAATPFAINGTAVGVCAVACTANGDCEDGDECISYSGADADAHCVNVIEEEYELCGVADTSICSEALTCLYFPDYPIGVCVSLCTTGGGDEDGGVGALATMCSGSQTCVEGILADPGPGEGVCGTLVARGDECGLEIGRYCGDDDVCAPEDPNDDSSTQRCFQDCSEPGVECDEGTCRVVPGLFAYCN